MNMDLFAEWIDEHHLYLNVKKSLLLSRRQEPLCTYTIRVNDYPIEKVQSYKYYISSDLSWGNHVSSVSGVCCIVTSTVTHCVPDTLRTLYISCVRPLLEHAMPVWDPHLVEDINTMESVQRFATKVCTKPGGM